MHRLDSERLDISGHIKQPFLLFILIASFFIPLHAAQTQSSLPQWSWERELWLEKEQQYKASFDVRGVSKELILRWTLYKNKGLVLHIQYDKFNHQEVLYTDYQRNAFKITLGREEAAQKVEPKLLIYFKDFKDGKAFLKLYIEGNGANLLNEELGESPSKLKKERAKAFEAFINGSNTNQNAQQNPNK